MCNVHVGRVVELNNQSKHSVSNHMKDTNRVHLIFDYVEDYPISRYTGEAEWCIIVLITIIIINKIIIICRCITANTTYFL